jgi:hypothetical protein
MTIIKSARRWTTEGQTPRIEGRMLHDARSVRRQYSMKKAERNKSMHVFLYWYSICTALCHAGDVVREVGVGSAPVDTP